jgi:hypothetical protein
VLARVDGTSPVGYLDTAQNHETRAIGRILLREPESTLDKLLERWALLVASTVA